MTVEHFLTNVVLPISLISIIFLLQWIRRIKGPNVSRPHSTKVFNPDPKPLYREPVTPAEKHIAEAGFKIADGPDKWSISIWKPMMGSLNATVQVAHYWPKSQWWNLIGRKEKGHGLDKMLEVLNNSNSNKEKQND
jgi:hypothetical protein